MGRTKEQKTDFAVRAGRRVRATREDRNWTQKKLSDETGGKLSPSRIANYEQGTRELGIQEAEILGKALHVQPGYLMGVTSLYNPLTPWEEELIRNLRALPENERSSYFRRIEALALAYRAPVADEALGPGWTAPKSVPPALEAPKAPRRAHRRKTSKV
jgi:transcriptional regulator with XRE-family HTH domain